MSADDKRGKLGGIIASIKKEILLNQKGNFQMYRASLLQNPLYLGEHLYIRKSFGLGG
jgi:hypothetical protein